MSDGNDEIGSIFKIIDFYNMSKGSLVGMCSRFLRLAASIEQVFSQGQ